MSGKNYCSCKETGRWQGCDASNGCPYIKAGSLVDSAMNGVEKKAEEIALEWQTECVPLPQKRNAFISGEPMPDTGCIMALPNGDQFRFRYDTANECIIVNKISDAEGAMKITFQPGGGINQIFIK